MDVLEGKWRVLLATLSTAIASLVFAANGFAAALVQDVKGDVRTQAATAVEKGQRIVTGATLTTGPNSQVILVFDDGQQVVLNENTQFAITDYQFAKENPQSDRSFFSLLRGAARVVTGALVQRNRGAFEFRTATATIGIRGTDFMLAIVDQPSYLSVLQGEVAATNAAGTVTFGAGTFGAISAATILAVAIPAVALPAAAASAFGSLGAAAVGAAAGAAAGAAGGAAGAAGIGTVAAVGGVAAAAAVASSTNKSSTTSTTSTPSTGTPSTGTSAFAGPAHGTITISFSGTSFGVTTSGSCSGTWSGTTDSAGVFSGTETIATCSIGATGVVLVNTPVPISWTLDATGNVPVTSFSSTNSGITSSCTFGTSGTFTSTTASFGLQCTSTGTIATTPPCTGNCSVNVTTTWTYTGTRP
jgi:hypothetical protein